MLKNILIQSGSLKKLGTIMDLTQYTQIVIFTDKNVAQYWLDTLQSNFEKPAPVLTIKVGEKEKNLQTVEKLWKFFQENKCDRNSLLINLGGGVVTDMGAFAASTFMRGISFINIPTTLLSQVDASVGGKTGFNFGDVKNLIGTFTEAEKVIIDPETLSTLPAREYRSGWGEIIKHGLIADKAYFELLKTAPGSDIEKIIQRSCELKSGVVTKDATEKSYRKILNFGHTLGHSVEILSEGKILHGEAIAIGMMGEAFISKELGYLTDTDLKTIQKTIEKFQLPTKTSGISKKDILAKITTDKKNKGEEVRWVLLEKIGKAMVDQSVPEEVVKKAIDFILE
jgi:3-dehydroquinate synthase